MGALAFVCAMPMELKPLSKRLGLQTTEVGGVTVRSGSLSIILIRSLYSSILIRNTPSLFFEFLPTRIFPK